MGLFKSREDKWIEREEHQTKEEQKRLNKEKYEQNIKELERKANDYVLTLSASDYVHGIGKDLTDYDFKSVHAQEGYNKYDVCESALTGIVRQGIKIGAEKIVDVRPSHRAFYSESYLFLIGTALIPKQKR